MKTTTPAIQPIHFFDLIQRLQAAEWKHCTCCNDTFCIMPAHQIEDRTGVLMVHL